MTAHWWKKDQYLQQVYMHWQMKEHDCSIKTESVRTIHHCPGHSKLKQISLLSNKADLSQSSWSHDEILLKYNFAIMYQRSRYTSFDTIFPVERSWATFQSNPHARATFFGSNTSSVQGHPMHHWNNNGHFAWLHCTVNPNIKTVNLKPQRSWP